MRIEICRNRTFNFFSNSKFNVNTECGKLINYKAAMKKYNNLIVDYRLECKHNELKCTKRCPLKR